MSSSERKLIVVSGFGPFIGHEEINASWEAVKLLPELLTAQNGTEYDLMKRLVAVEYEAVDEACTEIWSRQPEMVIHVGVSGIAKCVYVEKLAYNHKFRRADNSGQYLSNGSCVLPHNGKANVLRCGLDVDKIVEAVNATCEACVAPTMPHHSDKPLGATRVSKNVGDFLCGYIYLKSLDVDSKRSLFVHVPPINRPFSTEQTADIVLKIIQQCVQQVAASACSN
ncbi:pyroglutamyl-peptidase 1 [Drosophila obscura]|uniref:pyroglutamyl-peptidase 1 n=1 Tax=Drosophila obscura TaxID=7282 RepID=UPI000BA1753A|nr:pyroglutamyl-peptidase 1 [Drosophila obscura]XP_022211230.1 pyroglutamyl-peptidase 1 [Drosophila obscura]